MTDKRVEEIVKQALMIADIAYRGTGGEMRVDMRRGAVITRQQLRELERRISAAVLASARERAEALRIAHQGLCSSQMPTAPNHPECDCFSADYNNALDAAARAITEAT